MDFVEADFGNAETKAQLTAAGLTAPPGVLPMLSDPDNLRLQLVSATHGLFDTLMPGGRITTEPPAFTPIGLDHIMVSVTDVEKSAAHYRKLFGPEARARTTGNACGSGSQIKAGPEAAHEGQKPGFSQFCVKAAGFNRASTIAKLQKLGIRAEAGTEKGTVRFAI